ncbi:flagellar basal body rod protein FlgB [Parahaliea mediterranea]|uniref:flagellar basal body rod protein FlgB n=1 Tax=Parahaliea mediterranea TaxID=651086 RepID=UPI000E2F42A9|nr:flagellar basal body rod protein FlgB [Parahaliea mediterranea]
MIDKLSASLDFYQQALGLRHQRQQVLAANIANADTPNYKARDFDFAAALSRASASAGPLRLSTTHAGHMAGGTTGSAGRDLLYRVPDQPSLDGNTVDMNRERTQFADNSVRYQSALTLANARIQGLKAAMQSES